MPTYEYKCKECGDHFEVEQSFTDDPLTTIGDCNVKKVFGSVGIAFKGSGFYRNDSRSSSTRSSSSSESSSHSSKEKSGESSGSSSSNDSSSSSGSGEKSSSKTTATKAS